MILNILITCILIVAAIYGTIVYLFWRDIRRTKNKSQTTHQPENYWKQPIGQPFEIRYP